MTKLIDELELERADMSRSNCDYGELSGFAAAVDIVRAHNPWHEVGELPPEREKVIVGLEDGTVLMGIMDSENRWAIFYSDGLIRADISRPVIKWAYLPEVKP